MRVAALLVSLTLSSTVSGCSGDAAPASADCSAQVRSDGIVYTSYGYSDRPAQRYSMADRAECDDVGEDAAGSTFPEQARQVRTWTLRGYPPEQVVGVRFDNDSFAVFVADSVPEAERERILRELGGADAAGRRGQIADDDVRPANRGRHDLLPPGGGGAEEAAHPAP